MFVKKTYYPKGHAQQTPINAANMNDLENRIESAFYHKTGEQITVGGYFGGNLTGSNTTIQFTVPTPKLLDKINNASITGSVILRHADGGYIANNVNIEDIADITATYKMSNTISFNLVLKNAATNFTNNSTVIIVLQQCKITFI